MAYRNPKKGRSTWAKRPGDNTLVRPLRPKQVSALERANLSAKNSAIIHAYQRADQLRSGMKAGTREREAANQMFREIIGALGGKPGNDNSTSNLQKRASRLIRNRILYKTVKKGVKRGGGASKKRSGGAKKRARA